MRVEIGRVDAHPGDQYGLRTAVEVSDRLMLSELVTTVLEPFLWKAPRTVWWCRGRSHGQWRDFARVVTVGPAEQLGAELLVADRTVGDFAGPEDTTFSVVCQTRIRQQRRSPPET